MVGCRRDVGWADGRLPPWLLVEWHWWAKEGQQDYLGDVISSVLPFSP